MREYTLGVWRLVRFEAADDDAAVEAAKAAAGNVDGALGAVLSNGDMEEHESDVRRGTRGKQLWADRRD